MISTKSTTMCKITRHKGNHRAYSIVSLRTGMVLSFDRELTLDQALQEQVVTSQIMKSLRGLK